MIENQSQAGGIKAGQSNPAADPADHSAASAATPDLADEIVLAGKEDIRRYAAQQLVNHLKIGADLAERCELLSHRAKADKLGPLYAAARLAHANARVAEALANVVQIERRHRSIIERIQPPEPKNPELNSCFQGEGVGEAPSALEFWKRIEAYIDEAVYARMADQESDDGLRQLIRDIEEKVTHAEARQTEEVPDQEEPAPGDTA